jgi:diguanylate cyclase (GGDEF)-like protein
MEAAPPARVTTATSAWETLRARAAREHTALVSLVVVYIVAGRIGLAFGDTRAVSLVWPCAGIAVGALLVLGYRIWPAILGAALVMYASAFGVQPLVIGLALSNTAEALLAAYLVNRYAGGRHAFQDPRQCLRFVGVVLLAVLTTGATLSAVTVTVAHPPLGPEYGGIWLTHAIGSFAATLLVGPVIVQYSQLNTRVRFVQSRSLEPAIAFTLLTVCASIAFFDVRSPLTGFPKELLCLPLLFWVALRLGRRMASVALLILAVVAIGGTVYGTGPFARPAMQSSLIVLQFFMILSTVMTLVMATLAAEYSIAEAQLRELVVTDPLTGLPNYRRLLDVLGSEISRSDRSHRPFAVVFFDMDGLKRINDEHGHLVGSRAVCRFAETLRSACRTTDTAARYGGDEFVAVLSDTDSEGAKLVIRRTMQRLAEDADEPRLSVSAGLALYPKDGGTPTTLLSAADRALYAAKADKASAQKRVVAIREWTSAS